MNCILQRASGNTAQGSAWISFKCSPYTAGTVIKQLWCGTHCVFSCEGKGWTRWEHRKDACSKGGREGFVPTDPSNVLRHTGSHSWGCPVQDEELTWWSLWFPFISGYCMILWFCGSLPGCFGLTCIPTWWSYCRFTSCHLSPVLALGHTF